LESLAYDYPLFINPIIYSEISIGFQKIEELEFALERCGFKLLQIPKEALFLAGKASLKYRRMKEKKITPLPDFFYRCACRCFENGFVDPGSVKISNLFPDRSSALNGKRKII